MCRSSRCREIQHINRKMEVLESYWKCNAALCLMACLSAGPAGDSDGRHECSLLLTVRVLEVPTQAVSACLVIRERLT